MNIEFTNDYVSIRFGHCSYSFHKNIVGVPSNRNELYYRDTQSIKMTSGKKKPLIKHNNSINDNAVTITAIIHRTKCQTIF